MDSNSTSDSSRSRLEKELFQQWPRGMDRWQAYAFPRAVSRRLGVATLVEAVSFRLFFYLFSVLFLFSSSFCGLSSCSRR